jgi:hypothetical protein
MLKMTAAALIGARMVRPLSEGPIQDIQPADPQRGVDYSLAYIQFDDDGAFRSARQLEKVLEHASKMSHPNGIALVVFMHGWNNNCYPSNENLLCFTEVLKRCRF